MIYCDTSVLVAAFTAEPRAKELRDWLRSHADQLILSGWVEAEFASAIAMKQRTRALDNDTAKAALASYRAFADGMPFAPIERRHFTLAASLILKRVTALRSGDALHLAIAVGNDLQIATLDKVLAEMAEREGLPSPFKNQQ